MTNFSAANLREMPVMQKALNEQVFEAHGPGTKRKAMKNLTMAMIDEIGELTHELKANWCWWKKTQAPIQPDKVLEEYVDVFHFVMTKVLADETSGPDFFIEGFKFGTQAAADILDPASHIRSLIGCTTSRGMGAVNANVKPTNNCSEKCANFGWFYFDILLIKGGQNETKSNHPA